MANYGTWDNSTIVSSSGRHRQRHFYNDEQLSILDAEFQLNPFPNRENRRRISQRLGIPDKSVMWWFQNRRRRVRQQGPSSSSGGGLVIRNQRRQHRHTAGTNPYEPISPPIAYAENQQPEWHQQQQMTSPSAGYFQPESGEYQQQSQRSAWSSPPTTLFQQVPQVSAANTNQLVQPTTPVEGVNCVDYSDQDSPTSDDVSYFSYQQYSFPSYSECSYYPYSTSSYNFPSGQDQFYNNPSHTYC